MNSLCRFLLAPALLSIASFTSWAQAGPAAPVADTAVVTLDPALINPVNLQSFEAFRTTVQPLIKQMAHKKVVAMGEGTHGTAEFYRLRFWLTRILMEEHGFSQLALENDYSDTYQLHEELNQSSAPLVPLLKAHLYAIWQNQDMVEVLTWLQQYNRSHRRKLLLRGMDAAYVSPEAERLSALATRYPKAGLQDLAFQLLQVARAQDSVWDNSNKPGYELPKSWMANGLKGYYTAEKLQQALLTARLPRKLREEAAGFALDAKQAFDIFYQYKTYKRDSSRDSLMAEMTRFLVRGKNDKVIVWAHNGHVSRKIAMADDASNGGGMGSYLDRIFPGQYFVLGTSTATGTYAATTDQYITRTSLMASYPLEEPLAGSWEASLEAVNAPAFFLETRQLSSQNLKRPHRFVGYRPQSGKDSYSNFKLAEAYDALLFVRQTTAPTPLQ